MIKDKNKKKHLKRFKTTPKNFIAFESPISFYKNIKECYIKLEKEEEKQKQLKSEINNIVKGSKKSGNQKNAIENIKTLYESRENIIKLFHDYSRVVSEANTNQNIEKL